MRMAAPGSIRFCVRWKELTYASWASIRSRSTIGSNTPSPCCSSAWSGCLFTYAILRLQTCCCRSIRKDSAPLSEHLAFNTAASFTTNTNWQSYGGEGTMSYFSQMVGLTFHNFVSAADRHRHCRRAGPRHCAAYRTDDRQLLGRSRPRDLLPALPICVVFAVVPRLAGHDSELQALHQGDADRADARSQVEKKNDKGETIKDAEGKAGHGRTNRRPNKTSCKARWRRRSRSRCSARTAAVTPTPMPRSPSRTRRRSRTSFRCCRSFRSAAASLTTSAAW